MQKRLPLIAVMWHHPTRLQHKILTVHNGSVGLLLAVLLLLVPDLLADSSAAVLDSGGGVAAPFPPTESCLEVEAGDGLLGITVLGSNEGSWAWYNSTLLFAGAKKPRH